jgi:branched-subunit amino acid transport protein
VLELWALVACCIVGTYLWRGVGVLLSGRISVNGEVFKWIACVAYAMVAGLVSRIVIMPTGMLATDTALAERLIACGIALAAYYLSRRNILIGVGAGVAAIVAIATWAGA